MARHTVAIGLPTPIRYYQTFLKSGFITPARGNESNAMCA